MANFGQPFLRLTFAGTLHTVETWSATLSVIEFTDVGAAQPQPSVAELDQIRTAWKTRLMGSGGPIGMGATLSYVKAASIGADGHYTEPAPVMSVQPLSGSAGSGISPYPPQISLAVTLLGLNPRGPAGRGRFYLPAPTATLGSDGRITAAAALSTANAVAGLISDINGILPGEVGIVGPQTATGRAPARSVVRNVRVGRVLDTIRSRRSSMPEEPSLATTEVTGVA